MAGLCVSPGGEGRSLGVALGVGGWEASESADIGWDRGDGLFTRFESSDLGALVDDDESPSRIEVLEDCAEGVFPGSSFWDD